MILVTLLFLNIGLTQADSEDAVLFDAKMSSKYCSGAFKSKCYPADRALDHDYQAENDWNTSSITKDSIGTHWWEARMTTTMVQQVVLKARVSRDQKRITVTVSLYNGDTLAGKCQDLPDVYNPYLYISGDIHTLDCDRVAADRIRVAATSTRTAKMSLKVYGIRVIKAHCSKPAIGSLGVTENGNLAPNNKSIASGSSYTLTCNHGSKLTGPAKMTCSNGSLSSASWCVPVASFVQASSVPDTLHSPDQAIDNDLTTYSIIKAAPGKSASGSADKPLFMRVYFPALVELGTVTFKTYCFSKKDKFWIIMLYKDMIRSCSTYFCDSYGEVTATIVCDSEYQINNGHAFQIDYDPKNRKDPFILFDIKWSG